MITTCIKCGKAYDAQSEESANEPERYCEYCWWQLWDDGCAANDNNCASIRRGVGHWKNNPHAQGTMAHRRWNAGYNYRGMVNDG